MILRCRSSLSPLARNFSQVKRMFSSEQYDPPPSKNESNAVLFETVNCRGIITLNKPKALNAINLEMVVRMYDKLQEWEDKLEMVIIRGGEKAFCAGGDIVSITKDGPKNSAAGKAFFRTEYMLNNLIGTYRLPYIALIHGITMGGGFGLSVHGQYRIATETTLFAMPETAIGLFPDVGGTYILPRLEGKLGLYLALTGYRLKGTDVVKAGIATHFCEGIKLPSLCDAIVGMNRPACWLEQEVFPKYLTDVSSTKFSLGTKMDKINQIFSAPTVEEIFCRLEKDGSEWALGVLKDLKKMSPMSLKLTKRALDLGLNKTLQECLQMENRIGAAVMEARHSKDFYEGVRALLIDKDKNPKWSPSKLEDITDAMVDDYFVKLCPGEELII